MNHEDEIDNSISSIPDAFKEMNPFCRRTYFGCTRSGKSYRVKTKEIKPLLKIMSHAGQGKLIIYDPKHEYAGPNMVDIEYPSSCTIAIVDTVQSFQSAVVQHDADVIVIQPNALKLEGDEIEFFDEICKFIYIHKQQFRGSVLIVDEAESIAPVSKIPKFFNFVVKQLQAYHIGVVCISQRPAELHPSIRSQSEYITFFLVHMPRDLQALADMAGKEWVYKMTSDKNFSRKHKFICLHQSGEKIIGGENQ